MDREQIRKMMKQKAPKYSKSRIERVCGICRKPIHKGDEYQMIKSYKRFHEEPWPLCKNCEQS